MNDLLYGTATPYVAAFVIVRRQGKILFVLRSNTGWMDGYYGLPSGKVEKNESYSACAVREAREEVGVSVTHANLAYRHTMHRHGVDSDWVDVFFEAKNWKGEPQNSEPEVHSEIAWLDPKHFPKNVIPPVRQAILEIEAGNAYSEYGWKG